MHVVSAPHRAARVARVPVDQADGVHEQPGIAVAEQVTDLAQPPGLRPELAGQLPAHCEERLARKGSQVEVVTPGGLLGRHEGKVGPVDEGPSLVVDDEDLRVLPGRGEPLLGLTRRGVAVDGGA
jgi:hypothetical protein